MKLEDATAALIACDKGMGRMLPKACARFWRIANHGDAGKLQRECTGCPAGEKRAGLVMPRLRTDGTADRSCAFCGKAFAPNSPKHKFCKRVECKAARNRRDVKRHHDNRRGKT